MTADLTELKASARKIAEAVVGEWHSPGTVPTVLEVTIAAAAVVAERERCIEAVQEAAHKMSDPTQARVLIDAIRGGQ